MKTIQYASGHTADEGTVQASSNAISGATKWTAASLELTTMAVVTEYTAPQIYAQAVTVTAEYRATSGFEMIT